MNSNKICIGLILLHRILYHVLKKYCVFNNNNNNNINCSNNNVKYIVAENLVYRNGKYKSE